MAALKSREQFAKALGKKIRKIRTNRGISIKHFEAIEHSIDRHSLSDIEKGKKVPNAYTLYRIAFVLGVSTEEIMSA